jgi:nucleotide-binding universal stress UspA family protein
VKPAIADAASCAWLPASGAQDKWIATYGRVADLTVIGAPKDDTSVAATLAFEAALLDTGKSVLLAPSRPVALAGIAVVAWNGSAEAARAVAAALPLLAAAREVHVVTIEESQRRADPDALARYLAWHRIDARTRLIAGKGANAVTAIDEECEMHGANLLVMGGYTHSRLRELIFGGVTAHVVKHAALPVLLAH